MTAPRLEIDLDKIRFNAASLVQRLAARGIAVTGVTKVAAGLPAVANALLDAGIRQLGDSRIENIEALRRAGVAASMMLIRSPMPSQAQRVVRHADASLNSELAVIEKLSHAAREAGRMHQVVLMVELGDLREGILPADLEAFVARVLRLPNITLGGIGTNLACHGGVVPDRDNMGELTRLANALEQRFDLRLGLVSGGNSANLDWALGNSDVGRINNLRLGESIFLGCEPLHRRPIPGLHHDAMTLVAEVIESKLKPSRPHGRVAQNAFGEIPAVHDRGRIPRVILAIGRQDVDPAGLQPPPGFEILGASSDHLILTCASPCPRVGTELRFGLDYSALLRAMTSRFVAKVAHGTHSAMSPPRLRHCAP